MTSSSPHIYINERFRLIDKFGSGSFARVFMAIEDETGDICAVKIEPKRATMLCHEFRTYQAIHQSEEGQHLFPKIKWFGQEGEYNVLIMEGLGQSVEQIKQEKTHLSYTFIQKIAIQTLECLEFMHKVNYIHRDLKPQNILISTRGRLANRICLIDMGLSKQYKQANKHIAFRPNKMVGTAFFCSIAAHEHLELSRRDDLESLGYILLYLYLGTLPWANPPATLESKEKKYEYYYRLKKNFVGALLTHPQTFLFKRMRNQQAAQQLTQYFVWVSRLTFTEKPQYQHLKSLFIPTEPGSSSSRHY